MTFKMGCRKEGCLRLDNEKLITVLVLPIAIFKTWQVIKHLFHCFSHLKRIAQAVCSYSVISEELSCYIEHGRIRRFICLELLKEGVTKS